MSHSTRLTSRVRSSSEAVRAAERRLIAAMQERDDEIFRARDAGLPLDALAVGSGLPEHVVAQVLNRYPESGRFGPEGPGVQRQRARTETLVHLVEVNRALVSHSDELEAIRAVRDAAILGARAAGWTYDEIIARTGMSSTTITKARSRAATPLPHPAAADGSDGGSPGSRATV